jgi:hypothetical protein
MGLIQKSAPIQAFICRKDRAAVRQGTCYYYPEQIS